MNNKMDLSERLVDYILSLEPENSQALSLKALLLINRNEVYLAVNPIEEINMINDDFSYYVKAIYYSKLNVWEKAIENILKAIRLNDESTEYKYQLANYNYIIENYKKTIDICEEINSKNPKSSYTVGKDAKFAEIFSKLPQDLLNTIIKFTFSKRIKD